MVYLFIYSNDFGDREAVKTILNGMPEIVDWRYDLPNTFYLESEEEADKLADLIIEQKADARFLLVEVSKNRQGWLPKATWEFLNRNS